MGITTSLFGATAATTGARTETDADGTTGVSVTTGGTGAAPAATAATGASTTAAAAATSAAGPTADGGKMMEQDQQQHAEEERWPPHQCGLEDDEDQWVPWVHPPRIKETQLTAEEQTKFRGLLELIFSRPTIIGKKVVPAPQLVADVFDKVQHYLKSEPVLIEDVPFDVQSVGDIHGQLYDLDRVFRGVARDGKPGWECAKFVFLGDYVDRGRQSLEVVLALFILKMLYPDRIFLLRGNHEFLATNMRYGTCDDLHERYSDTMSIQLFMKMNAAFCFLSIACIVGDTYFCSHGGISCHGFTRRQMRAIKKPIKTSNKDQLVHDLVWSDPADGLRGTTFNKDRDSSIFFGFDALCRALESMQVVAIFRAHQRIMDGAEVSWNTCFSVFTATDYGGSGNKGGIGVVDAKGVVSFRILEVDPVRSKWEQRLEYLDLGIAVDDLPDEHRTLAAYDDMGRGGVEHI